jgi:hypothetical protein
MTVNQIIMGGVGVIALSAGITIAVSLLCNTCSVDKSGPVGTSESPIDFPYRPKPRYEESYTAGHQAFPFKSISDTATIVGVSSKNCKCSSVEICIEPEGWKSLEADELISKGDNPTLNWVTLEKDGEGFSIPARADGWVRIGWNDDKTGHERFSAELWAFDPSSGVRFTLDVAVNFIDAVKIGRAGQLDESDANVGKLGPGEHREVEFLIWSCIREKLTIEAVLRREDPCVIVSAAKPLGGKELELLPKQQERKALCGYRVQITVTERNGENQLDIGPFRRRIAWKTDASIQPLRASVYGRVLGEVSAYVAGKGDERRLEMGRIDPDNPVVHSIFIESENLDVELAPDEKKCDFLKVELQEGAKGKVVRLSDGTTRRTWTVDVSFRPDSGFRGLFPDKDRPGYGMEECVVAFKILNIGVTSERPRRVRVPVSGQVAN